MTDPDFLQLPPMTILETARLRLRTVRVSDAASLLPIITDRTTMKFTSGVVANDREVAERWLSARALGRDVLNFVITLKNGEEGGEVEGKDERIGKEVVGIMGSYHWPEVGYLMHPGESVLVLASIDVELLQECYPSDRFYAPIIFNE
jgi:RimJ/RimL family protein N-acetyltransferase